MIILLISNEYQPPLKEIVFNLDVGVLYVTNEDKRFGKADIIDLYNSDVEFVTIDYFKKDGDKYPKESKIIRKNNIDHIDIIYDS